jgi:puromycin-sensitive aminopeptidase
MLETAVNPFRLPTNAKPSRYDLTMAPDLGQKDFVGDVKIALDISEPTDRLTCNAIDLTITAAWVVSADGTRNEASASMDAEGERVTFICARTIPAGPSSLHVQFTGALNDKLVGFYASTYEGDDGSTKVIATTQMEATDARRAFPCWDEPDAKAVFAITLVVAPGLMAVSNMHEASSSTLPSGKRAVRFADTPIMSSYLVCMVVGDLEATEPVDVDGVPLRVIARPGRQAQAAFALEIGAFALRYFRDWYGIPYPGTKMDLIATPDFAFGAMENLGAVTFREALLLVDEAKASKPELERIADVVAHEIAHMWFGDLVTMKWWNGLWLNEAFATFAEVSCVAKFRPEWERWNSFALYRSMAQQVDALHSTRPIEFPVISPSDADAMFDVLTYEKGASVLRMLEQYLGEEQFRLGVKHYLEQHAFANAETTDLWDAIEHVTSAPVRRLMDSWILQGGFPIVHATQTPTGAITLGQEPFTYLSDGTDTRQWEVPVIYRSLTTASAEPRTALLGADRITATDFAPFTGVLVNAGGHGFYRVHYDDALAQNVAASFSSLAPVERYGVVSDMWASVLAGKGTISSFLTIVRALRSERDPNVWSAALVGLRRLDAIADDASRAKLQSIVRGLLGPIVEELGSARSADESPLTSSLRGTLTEALSSLGDDPGVVDRANAMFDRVLADDGSVDPDLGPALLTIAASHGDAARYARISTARTSTSSPQAELRLLHALGEFTDPALVAKTLASLLTDEVRTQDAPYALLRMLGSRRNGIATWNHVRDNWATIIERLPESALPRMLEGITTQTAEPAATEIDAFFTTGPGASFAAGKKTVTQHLERLRVHRRLATRGAELATALG